jgi:WD40 repeat protein
LIELERDGPSGSKLAFHGDGQRLAVASSSSIHILDLQSRRSVRSLDVSRRVNGAVAFSVDGSRVAAGLDGGLALFDDALRQQALIARFEENTNVQHVAFSPDGQWIAAGLAGDRPTAKVWPAAGGGDGVTLDTNEATFGPQPPAFSGDSRWLATFTTGESVKLWSTGSWKVERTLKLPGRGEALMFAPRGPRLAIAAAGETAIWDGHTGRKLVKLTGPGLSRGTQIAWSPDGHRVVTSSDDGVLRFWSASDGRLIASLYALAETRDWLLVTPDGRFDGSERALATVVAWRTGDRVSLDKRLTDRHRVRGLWRHLSTRGPRPRE